MYCLIHDLHIFTVGKDENMNNCRVQGMQTIINVANTDNKQQQIYLLQLQIREATQKLALPSLGMAF